MSPLREHLLIAARAARPVTVAVVSDSLEDVTVVRLAIDWTQTEQGRLVLAVPMPEQPIGGGLAAGPQATLPVDARIAVGLVTPMLDASGLGWDVLGVPVPPASDLAMSRNRRIGTALLAAARLLSARRLLVGEFACWRRDPPSVADLLLAAEGSHAAGRTRIHIVRTEAATLLKASDLPPTSP